MKKIMTALAALGLVLGLVSGGMASGMFQNLPASTSAGTLPATGGTTGGQAIGADDAIPLDTGNTQGINPATMVVSPSQLAGFVGGLGWTQLKYTSIPIGGVAYGSLGTNTTPVAGTIYYAQLNLPVGLTITNIGCMNGGTAATDKLIYGLYSSAGALLASTALAGVVASGTDAFQEIPLTATYAAVPGQYFVAWQTNGNTTRFRTVATLTYVSWIEGSQTGGTFGTLGAITTPATGITADKGPICYVN